MSKTLRAGGAALSSVVIGDETKEHKHHHHKHKHSHGSHGHGACSSSCDSHGFGHHHDYSKQSPRSLLLALLVVSVYFIAEIIGGFIANSLALLTDGCHVLTDIAAVGLSLFAVTVASKHTSKRQFSFGFHRLEVLFAFMIILLVWALAGFLAYEGFMRFQEPQPVEGGVMIFIAAVGVLVNLFLLYIFQHDQKDSINIKALFLHALSDLVANLGVLLSGFLIWMTGWQRVDPLITMGCAVFVAASSFKVFKDVVYILLEGAPDATDPYCISFDLKRLAGIEEIHEMHVWSLKPGHVAMSCHIVIAQDYIVQNGDAAAVILKQAQDLVLKKYHIEHATIQIERQGIDNVCKTRSCAFLPIAGPQS
eukprot:GILK01005504.1.p1 GENE.GILK01005504.1~~GILK01005504.1.p1  ORF type:complete len:379 (-),score=42.07 GILK01005504.1:190-1284(-)